MIKGLETRDLKQNVYITYSFISENNTLCYFVIGGGGPSTWGEASRKAGNMKLKNACIMSMNKRKKNSSPGDYNFEAYFPKNYFVIF